MTDPRAEQLLERLRANGAPPRHIAVIMDGNGRWAADRGLPRWMGHREGMKAVRRVVEGALAAGVSYLTLYAFSRENWDRPAGEVAALMRLLVEYVDREREELRDRGVRVHMIGERQRLSEPAQAAIDLLEATTSGGENLELQLAISYGSRHEIVEAARELARRAVSGDVDPPAISEEMVAGALYTSGRPDPDLLIRTSGELRLSNFLLWQIAYAEIHVTPVLWPDFGQVDLYEAIIDYQGRDRRFGRVSA